jgi:hypothetical protein
MTERERNNKKKIVLDYLRKLPIYKWAAAAAMIDEDTLKHWKDEDKVFSDQCEAAKSEAINKYAGRATPDFILKNVDHDSFKDKHEIEHSGTVNITKLSYKDAVK